jgi:hypothetical protein
MSLKTTHIPVYTLLSFIKKLARTSVLVDAARSEFLVLYLGELLVDPRVSGLVHDTNQQVYDEYDVDVSNLEEVNAGDTQVWELQALEKHYYHKIRSLTSTIENRLKAGNVVKQDLTVVGGQGMKEVFSREVQGDGKSVSVAFESVGDGLWY